MTGLWLVLGPLLDLLSRSACLVHEHKAIAFIMNCSVCCLSVEGTVCLQLTVRCWVSFPDEAGPDVMALLVLLGVSQHLITIPFVEFILLQGSACRATRLAPHTIVDFYRRPVQLKFKYNEENYAFEGQHAVREQPDLRWCVLLSGDNRAYWLCHIRWREKREMAEEISAVWVFGGKESTWP